MDRVCRHSGDESNDIDAQDTTTHGRDADSERDIDEERPDLIGIPDAVDRDLTPVEDVDISDADDVLPDISTCSPGLDELCDTPVDDNCNGQVNEGCSTCCAGGCRAGTMCSSECECLPYDPAVCTSQNQRCSHEGFNNGYYCASAAPGEPLRCIGLCNRNAPSPDETCPDSSSVCAFEVRGSGVCLSGCSPEQGCQISGYGCLPLSGTARGGVCVLVNPDNQVGDHCDPDARFDCAAGLVCADLPRGARCVEACRAFAHLEDDGSDCTTGHCMPIGNRLGICRIDVPGVSQGDSCQPTGFLQTCGQDAVICGTIQAGGSRCLRLCRLEQGSEDCGGIGECLPYSSEQEDMGVCVSLGG